MILKGIEFQGWIAFYEVSDQCSLANGPADTPSERTQLVAVCSFKHFTTNSRDTKCVHIHVYTHSLFHRLSTTPWPSTALPPSTRTHIHMHMNTHTHTHTRTRTHTHTHKRTLTHTHTHTRTNVDHVYACFEPTTTHHQRHYRRLNHRHHQHQHQSKQSKTNNKNHAVTSQHDVCYNVTTHITTTTINITARTTLPSPPPPGPPDSNTAAPQNQMQCTKYITHSFCDVYVVAQMWNWKRYLPEKRKETT